MKKWQHQNFLRTLLMTACLAGSTFGLTACGVYEVTLQSTLEEAANPATTPIASSSIQGIHVGPAVIQGSGSQVDMKARLIMGNRALSGTEVDAKINLGPSNQ